MPNNNSNEHFLNWAASGFRRVKPNHNKMKYIRSASSSPFTPNNKNNNNHHKRKTHKKNNKRGGSRKKGRKY
jgi:hypothetical protein